MKIILFSGKAECGKTSAAMMTANKLRDMGYKVVHLAYADYVKQTAKDIFGWDGKKDVEGRKLLQWWGTDYVRAQDPTFWVNTVVRLAKVIDGLFDFAVIDDCRFENELTCWDGFESYTVRVERPGHESALTAEQRSHPSETGLDGYDFKIRLSAMDWAGLVEQVDTVLLPLLLTAKAEEAERSGG